MERSMSVVLISPTPETEFSPWKTHKIYLSNKDKRGAPSVNTHKHAHTFCNYPLWVRLSLRSIALLVHVILIRLLCYCEGHFTTLTASILTMDGQNNGLKMEVAYHLR